MKAAVVYEYGKPIEVAELTLGELADNDVLVRIEASGLCHSDVAVQEGGLPFPTPNIVGHEGAGVVEAIGRGVTTVSPGDHVVLSALMSCGLCAYCQKGRPNLCAWGLPTIFGCKHPDGNFRAADGNGRDLFQFACIGTLASKTIVPEISVIKIPEDVPFEVAALVGCGVVTGLGAVFHRAKVGPGATCAVIGAGGVGLNVIQGCRIAGATTIVAIDPVGSKRDLASDFGATHLLDPTNEPVVERIVELTGGVGADFVFECVGKGTLFRQAWDACGVDGTVLAIGVATTEDVTELPSQSFSTSEKTLMSCLYGTSRPRMDMPLYIEMYRQGRLKLDELVTRRYPIEQINEAIADMHAGVNARGVIVF
jgi:S-(hydroxymethyl)glutathione dehydrogenase / alcohol dehydrogenase